MTGNYLCISVLKWLLISKYIYKIIPEQLAVDGRIYFLISFLAGNRY